MVKYCIKVFDSDDKLVMQVVVPKEELAFHLESLKAFGTVKGFVLDGENTERIM